MKRISYRERDYAFGQLMFTLRTQLGLTQTDLGQRLGLSRRAVAQWEAGSSYPDSHHLKQLIELAMQLQAFHPRQEAEEIRALWKAAHQKVLLDEVWLSALLKPPSAPPPSRWVEEVGGAMVGSAPPAASPAPTDGVLASPPEPSPLAVELLASRTPAMSGPRVDWGDALDVSSFYGRQGELATLAQWIVEERCRVVSVLGMGGIGKSALVVQAMRDLAAHFQVVLFRSLRDAPSCEALLESCLQVLAPEALVREPQDLSARLSLLLEELRSRRVLLVLDNLEVLLQKGDAQGHLRPSYEGYGRLLELVAQTKHQSCLLLTSREKPTALRPLEGRRTLVRSLRLSGLEAAAGEHLLAEHELVGSPQECARLVQTYVGNPLALNIVARTIADLFGGEIHPFLSADTTIFGSISQLLEEQWDRLSPPEQTLLYWLAILREPVTLDDLLSVLVTPPGPVPLLEAVDGLRRRSLIEHGQWPGSFTLQSVVLEYVTERLVLTAGQEIRQDRLSLLLSHGLSQATAREYVRQTQERLLVVPLLARLQGTEPGYLDVEERLRSLLDEVRTWAQDIQGYGPANLVTLLRVLRGHLRGLDLSHLALRGVSLQGIDMQDTTLSHAMIQDSVFTERFDVSLRVAISSTGAYWVVASRGGEIRVWEEGGLIVRQVWRAHTDMVWALTFSPDGRTLASGSSSGSVKLWDIESGTLLWGAWLTRSITWLAFSPAGDRLASGGLDGIVQLWDPKLGTPLKELPHPSAVCSLAWSLDEKLLASGCSDGSIWLWEPGEPEPDSSVQRLWGHSQWVAGLAFGPDGVLASGSYDGTVKLWDTTSGSCLQTFSGHTDRVIRLVWSSDGRTLASCSVDHTIRFWDIKEGRARMVLQGHTDVVSSLAFTPDSRTLLSGSNDGTVRVWDVESGQCLRIIGGYAAPLLDIDWSPDGTQLASGGADTLVTLWEGASMTSSRVLHGHHDIVQGVAWSPDGQLLVSGGHDGIGLWNPASGVHLEMLQDSDTPNTVFQGVAWSPDGRLLACGSYLRGVQVWDMTTRTRSWVGYTEPTRIRRVAFSPDGTQLVGGCDDGSVYMWDASDGTRLLRLARHHGAITSVAFSPDGTWLASGCGSQGQEGSGELFVWQVQSGECVRAFSEHPSSVSALSWAVSGEVVSGGSDGRLRWWDMHSGQCIREQEAHQGKVQALKVSPNESLLASCGEDGAIHIWDLESGEHLRTLRRDRPYERLNITGIRGLTRAEIATLRTLGAVQDEVDEQSSSIEQAARL